MTGRQWFVVVAAGIVAALPILQLLVLVAVSTVGHTVPV